jgi:transcriptional regulator with XRE-family HTH domain
MTGEQNAKANEPAPAGLTRGQVAERLGVSLATVRRLEGKRLHPRLEDGVWLFDPLEVAAVMAQRGTTKAAEMVKPGSAGAVAAVVFGLLDDHRGFREIVQLTEQPPEVVRALHRQWLSGFVLPPEDDDHALEEARDRDERELRAWEQQMMEFSRREDELDLRRREFPSGRRLKGRGPLLAGKRP